MRVIHHDGRTGYFEFCHPHSIVGAITFDDGSVSEQRSVLSHLKHVRQLGPIEDELRRDPEELRSEACEFWAAFLDSAPHGWISEEIDSEAIEACCRIYEQHGDVL